MIRSKVFARALVILAVASLLAACAALEARRQLQQYDEYFSPLIGTARQADIVRKFGEPIRKDKVGAGELWYYHLSGKDLQSGQTRGGFEGGYAVGSDRDIYDDLTVEFDAKGFLKSWRGYIQR